jgi:hypothetical protein
MGYKPTMRGNICTPGMPTVAMSTRLCRLTVFEDIPLRVSTRATSRPWPARPTILPGGSTSGLDPGPVSDTGNAGGRIDRPMSHPVIPMEFK